MYIHLVRLPGGTLNLGCIDGCFDLPIGLFGLYGDGFPGKFIFLLMLFLISCIFKINNSIFLN